MEKLLYKYLNDNLTQDEVKELQTWLENDKNNLRVFENIVGDWNLSNKYIDDSKEKVLSKILSENKSIAKEISMHRLLWSRATKKIAIAAAAVIALFVLNLYDFGFDSNKSLIVEPFQMIESGKSKATLTLDNGKKIDLVEEQNLNLKLDGTTIVGGRNSITYLNKPSDSKKQKYNSLKTPRGGEFFITLSDSTKVWLNAESELKYPLVFLGDKRTVELKGEAFFEVAHNQNIPFQVVTNDQIIEVLGTTFNISSYQDDAEVITTLIEGKVKVNQKFGDKKSIFLSPSEQSILNKENLKIESFKIDPAHFIAWKSGKFYFRQQKLKDITKVLSRWYDVEIFFVNSYLENKRFTGRFKRYENFDHVRSVIELTEEVTLVKKGRIILVK
ncbi:FecR family protein [Flavobacteriaceae bacterium]|jgi:ferric-dicitrate binding protein FerR (iron transport regulator)|nr:FecR family protein [Flavobacteriaceae bacterium]MDB4326645.1 FecR family protein [Flavobacteriaceae bacterium]